MNILVISSVLPRNSHGLSWSVPASVDAQSKIDNVLWINTNEGYLSHWIKVKSFHRLNEYGKLRLESFPKPFDYPDVVIFEGFYNNINEVFFANELYKKAIPYVIVPRSALTFQAYNNHAWLKKRIAHFLFYNKFIFRSAAIQYLTKQEQMDSYKVFPHKSFVVPNGFNSPIKSKNTFHTGSIKAIFIGRIVPHQKALDILIPAIGRVKNMAREVNFTLDVYGPVHKETREIQKLIDKYEIGDIIHLKGEIKGDAKETVILDADLFVLTSRFEGHPMGLIEALAYGLPCIVTPGSNMKDEVEFYDAGWTTELSVEGISNKFIEIFGNRNLFLLKSGNAKKLADHYNWNKLAKNLHIELEKIISHNSY